MNGYRQIHIGARPLDPDIVKKTIPRIIDLSVTINQFRENAYNSNNNEQESLIGREQYDNVISILGDRGIGKTSTLLTIMNEIYSQKYFSDEILPVNSEINICSPLIAPEDMSENSDILGWIIVILENIYQERKSKIENIYYLFDKDTRDIFERIDRELMQIKTTYQCRKEESRHVINNNYVSTDDYARLKIEVERNDFQLVGLFNKTIDDIIELQRIFIKQINFNNRYNPKFPDEFSQEPLIFFFFDDVDVVTKHSINILRDIVTFLSHPNIVVFVSGDYKIFSQSATLHMLGEERLHHGEMEQIYVYGNDQSKYNTAISLAKSRSESFLRKVLPPMYRYELKFLTNESKALMRYSNDISDDKSNYYNILELVSEVFHLPRDEFDNFLYIGHKSYFSSFETPNDKKVELENKKNFFENHGKYLTYQNFNKFKKALSKNYRTNYYIVYPYLSVFSAGARGFMNAYNYLYKMYFQNKTWTLSDLSDFLDVLINSKSTYLRYKQQIYKFLRIKDRDNQATNLVIDCEELLLFLKELPDPKNEKELNEYESLIMLPMFFNELAYVIFGSENKDIYKKRYERVRSKLKELFLNHFLKKINNDLYLLPQNQTIKMILSFYHRVKTRMSLDALKYIIIDEHMNYKNDDYNIRNDKKYFIQLFRCFLYFNEIIYFKDKNTTKQKYYLFLDEKWYSIEQTDSDKSFKLEQVTLSNEKLVIEFLDEESYRQACINDSDDSYIRERMEFILFSFILNQFKKYDPKYCQLMKRHINSCLITFNKYEELYDLYPFENFYMNHIIQVLDYIKLWNSDSNTDKLNSNIIAISEMIDVSLLFDNKKKAELYKYIYDYLGFLFKTDSSGDKSKFLNEFEEIINYHSLKEIEKIENNDGKKHIIQLCDIVIGEYKKIHQYIRYDNSFDKYEIIDVAYIIINGIIERINIPLSINMENSIINYVKELLRRFNRELLNSFIKYLSDSLESLQQGNVTFNIKDCIRFTTKVIYDETRNIRGSDFKIDEEKHKEITETLFNLLHIYIACLYLKTSFLDENIKIDHFFFYNLSKVYNDQ